MIHTLSIDTRYKVVIGFMVGWVVEVACLMAFGLWLLPSMWAFLPVAWGTLMSLFTDKWGEFCVRVILPEVYAIRRHGS